VVFKQGNDFHESKSDELHEKHGIFKKRVFAYSKHSKSYWEPPSCWTEFIL